MSRTKAGGEALIALTVDSMIPEAAIEQIAGMIGAAAVFAVDLDYALS